MAAGKQKNTPVIVMKKKRHIISPPPPELPSGTVENEMPAHQAKKKQKMDAGIHQHQSRKG